MGTTSPTTDNPHQSPRLAALGSTPGAADVDAFWQEVASNGTPLIEPADTKGRALATFLWRGDDTTTNVVLDHYLTGGDFADKRMTRLGSTDVWYLTFELRDDLRSEYVFSPNDSLVPRNEETDWETRRANWQSDPYAREFVCPPDVRLEGDSIDAVVAMPQAPRSPYLLGDASTIQGVVTSHRFTSQLLGNERDVWLYVHPRVGQEQDDTPVVVQFDGEHSLRTMRLATMLDALVDAGQIDPCIAIMVGNVDRANELPCNAAFVSMLQEELLPWALRITHVKTRPERTVVTGVSYGGLAAMFAGITAPETFGAVIAQSGSFWWKPNPLNVDAAPAIGDAPEYEWLARQVVELSRMPARIWMESGTLEGRSFRDAMPTLLASNRHLRDVLRAKGVDVMYREYVGGHDRSCWRESLPEALIAVLRG